MLKQDKSNLTKGPLFKSLIIYAIPLIITNVLQLLFNAADVAVLSFFAGDNPVAAVGSTAALVNLIVGLFVGLSVGANVLVARAIGEQNKETSQRIVGTSILMSVLMGIGLACVGYFGSRTFLIWMSCDSAVLDLATTYLQIYFMGMPIIMLYNFCASILRASGDTLRPLLFLLLGGVVNVGLNVLFVVVFHKDVEGVAIATVASQAISATLSLILLLKNKGYAHLKLSKLRIHKTELLNMIRIGLPAGLQSCVFSISNVLIQSSINSFGPAAMSGNTYGHQLDGFIFQAMNAIGLTTVTFVSQNLGAGNFPRIRKTVRYALLLSGGMGGILGLILLACAPFICSLLTEDPLVLHYAILRIQLVGAPYLFCGLLDIMSSTMRGLGKSTIAMLISVFGTCVLRVLWLMTIFRIPEFHTMACVYISYPISWIFTLIIYLFFYFPTLKRLEERHAFEAYLEAAASPSHP